jgi:transcription elongation factor Elf1
MKEKRVKIKPNGKIYLVYCRNCEHVFFDSFDEEKIKDKKLDTILVCPFCGSKWLIA